MLEHQLWHPWVSSEFPDAREPAVTCESNLGEHGQGLRPLPLLDAEMLGQELGGGKEDCALLEPKIEQARPLMPHRYWRESLVRREGILGDVVAIADTLCEDRTSESVGGTVAKPRPCHELPLEVEPEGPMNQV
jgi:hypothetical protein